MQVKKKIKKEPSPRFEDLTVNLRRARTEKKRNNHKPE